MDVIVIQQENNSLLSTPFFVQFGILDIFKTKDKLINIEVNGNKINSIKMRLFENGVGYFASDEPNLNESTKTVRSVPQSPRESNRTRFNLRSLRYYCNITSALEKTLSNSSTEQINGKKRLTIKYESKRAAMSSQHSCNENESLNTDITIESVDTISDIIEDEVSLTRISKGSNSPDIDFDEVEFFEIEQPLNLQTPKRCTSLKLQSGKFQLPPEIL